MAAPGPAYEAMGRVAYEFARLQPFIPTYLHLLVSAVFPIYAGAHASLSRPSSAAKPRKKITDNEAELDHDEGDEVHESTMEGLSPADAIWFPLFAGLTLGGLYLLIKWLEDPAILNKLLNWYFSAFGILSVGKLLGDSLTFATSFVYPTRWSKGSSTWHVNAKQRRFVRQASTTTDSSTTAGQLTSPLPGWMSSVSLPPRVASGLWTIRLLLTELWTLHVRIHGGTLFRTRFGFHDIVGILCGVVSVVVYNFIDKPWWLTNLMGFGFAYGALQMMSPTTFWTGTMILSSLFLYDIYFVFFTPLMVTVATSLDIPIKLLFPRPAPASGDASKQNLAMLGLGDVVLPGIMIGLALRFDLYLFYLRKQQERPSIKATVSDDETEPETRPTEIHKARYISASGGWGERFWTSSNHTEGGSFPKFYFYAGLVGYVIGMLVTLGVMQVAGHAQPALLYLVPGVLGSLWGTALIRGEVKHMWQYSENEDEHDPSAKQTSIFSVSKKADEKVKKASEKSDEREKTARHSSTKPSSASREVLSMTITAPPLSTSKRSDGVVDASHKTSEDVDATSTSLELSPDTTVPRKDEPPAEKRRRRG